MKNKRLVIYHIISSILLTGMALALGFGFWRIFLRTWQVMKEFGLSAAYYVQFIFNADWGIVPILNQTNYIPGFSYDFLPETWITFFYKLGCIFEQLFNGLFWKMLWYSVSPRIEFVSRILLILMPLFIVIFLVIKRYFGMHDEEIGQISKPLIIYKKVSDGIYKVFSEIRDFFYFFFHTFYRIIFVILVLFFTNIINILLAFISWYLYFVCSFDFASIWYQFKRLVVDLSHLFRPFFVPLWVLMGIYIFYKIFKKIAMQRLISLHGHDVCFINDLGIDNLVVGNVNKGKTTLITDMSITTEMIFNDVALDKLVTISALFPEYDFRSFEIDIEKAREDHLIYNLSSIKTWCSTSIPGEYKDVGVESGNSFISLYDSLTNYALSYFVYTARSSYIYGSISIRSARFCYSDIHLKQYVDDFLNPSIESYEKSNFAHIFDYNNFRLEKKIPNRLEWSCAADIGIYLFDEIGKERLNQIELEDVRKGSDETNQKNDGFNKYMKMARHSSTIDNYPFFKVFGSEQRMDSVPADYRELNDYILQVEDSTKQKNVLPFYFFIDWILTLTYDFLKKHFLNWRFNRDKETVIFHLIKYWLSKVTILRKNLENKYGYKIASLKLYDGHENYIRDGKYYLLMCKIYANRFKTDAYGDFFNDRGNKSSYGLDDVPSYKSEMATLKELEMTNSYFINSLMGKKNKDVKSKYSNWKTEEEIQNGRKKN